MTISVHFLFLAEKRCWRIRNKWRMLGCFDTFYLKIVWGLPFFSLYLKEYAIQVKWWKRNFCVHGTHPCVCVKQNYLRLLTAFKRYLIHSKFSVEGIQSICDLPLPDNEMKWRRIQSFHSSNLSVFYGFCGTLLCDLLSWSYEKAFNLLLFLMKSTGHTEKRLSSEMCVLNKNESR